MSAPLLLFVPSLSLSLSLSLSQPPPRCYARAESESAARGDWAEAGEDGTNVPDAKGAVVEGGEEVELVRGPGDVQRRVPRTVMMAVSDDEESSATILSTDAIARRR